LELAARQVSIGDGSYFEKAKTYTTKLKELPEKYEENFRSQASFKTWKKYCLENFKKYFGEDGLLANIRYVDLGTYRNHLRQKLTRDGSIRKDSTVNREMSVLSHLFTKAKEWDLIEKSPFGRGKNLQMKEDNQRTRYLTEDELQRLLAECPKHLKRIVICAVNTGMDRGEILRLKWNQLSRGFIYLPRYKRPARQIPINEDLDRLFKEIRREQRFTSDYLFTYAKSEDKLKGKDPVRKRRGPAPVAERVKSIKSAFHAALKRAGIVDFRLKDLRHTFASHMVMRGASMKELQ